MLQKELTPFFSNTYISLPTRRDEENKIIFDRDKQSLTRKIHCLFSDKLSPWQSPLLRQNDWLVQVECELFYYDNLEKVLEGHVPNMHDEAELAARCIEEGDSEVRLDSPMLFDGYVLTEASAALTNAFCVVCFELHR